MIKGFFQFVFGLIRFAFILIILALVFHTWAIKQTLKFSLSYHLGADVSIREVKMDWKNTGVEVHGIEIGNPYEFTRGTLAQIPLMIISMDVPALAQGKLHLKTLGFDLRELQVINAKEKGLNLLALKPFQRAKEQGEAPFGGEGQGRRYAAPVSIDELIFSIGDISYVDMSGATLKQRTLRAGIRGATYYDIRGTDDVVMIVATEALKKIGFGYLDAQLQKIQERYLSSGIKKDDFLGRTLSAIKEKLSS